MSLNKKGKTIYQPSGRANEYSSWACNFYNGCSGKCAYCYNRTGRYSKIIGRDEPTLKKILVNEIFAINTFQSEINKNIKELKKHGLFFNFVSDPCLPETISLNIKAIKYCDSLNIPTILLTKQSWWINDTPLFPKSCKIGMTLTGYDEKEPGCSINGKRIFGLKYLHREGYKTWASIEPIIDLKKSFEMIEKSFMYVNHFKIGLQKGQKFDRRELEDFLLDVDQLLKFTNITIYYKDSFLEQADINRLYLPENCVDRDFNF
jgi:DNA repair photolyase